MTHPTHLPVDSLDAALRVWATDAPNDVAVIVDETTVTCGELVARIDDIAAWCAAQTTPGARVGLLATNSVDVVAALYGVPAAGRVLVPLNVRHSPIELRAQLDRSGAEVVLGTADLVETLPADNPAAPVVLQQVGTGSAGSNAHRLVAQRWLADDPRGASAPQSGAAWVIFTSGSTGPPKGVLLTPESLRAAIATTARSRPMADDDVYLYPFPLYHVSAYNVLHAHLRRRPVVVVRKFDARRIIELADRHRVTAMSLAPTMLRMLLDELAQHPATALGSLRAINYGAAAMPEALLREADATLGCGFAQGYGMTELSGNAAFLTPDQHRLGLSGDARFLRAAGYAGDGVALRIVAEDGAEVPRGQTGEVVVSGAQVCAGYLDDPAATSQTIRAGWLHTGDLGVLDDDGLLHIVDRAKDIVVTGGENVTSREVEEVLLSHPIVAQVAVVGLPDDRWGEAVTAVIVAAPGADAALSADEQAVADILREHVGQQLAGYKKPRRVFIVDALPVNAGGKVDKPALRRRFS